MLASFSIVYVLHGRVCSEEYDFFVRDKVNKHDVLILGDINLLRLAICTGITER